MSLDVLASLVDSSEVVTLEVSFLVSSGRESVYHKSVSLNLNSFTSGFRAVVLWGYTGRL